jgi:hypothetical protein
MSDDLDHDDDLSQFENHLPDAVRRSAERAEALARASQPPSGPSPARTRQPDHRDPTALRAEAERHKREEARLRGIIDGLQRKADAAAQAAIELEEQARANELAQTVVPFARRKRWGSMTIVSAPSDTEVERSADPDAVERKAAARAHAESARQ